MNRAIAAIPAAAVLVLTTTTTGHTAPAKAPNPTWRVESCSQVKDFFPTVHMCIAVVYQKHQTSDGMYMYSESWWLENRNFECGGSGAPWFCLESDPSVYYFDHLKIRSNAADGTQVAVKFTDDGRTLTKANGEYTRYEFNQDQYGGHLDTNMPQFQVDMSGFIRFDLGTHDTHEWMEIIVKQGGGFECSSEQGNESCNKTDVS